MKKIILKNVLRLSLLLFSLSVYGQKDQLVGFWEVKTVAMGNQNMTPVAKWTKINADGTFQSGNGWLQHSYGSWEYDADSHVFLPVDSLGLIDELGGFTVSFEAGKMFWEREEEGMPLKVTLHAIEQLPMSPADYLEGLWDLVEITKDGQSVLGSFDPSNKHKLQIRWDRMYVDFTPGGKKQMGYWHIHSHRPEITLLPHQEGQKPEAWRVEVDDQSLIMQGISDGNRMIQRKYERKNSH